MNAIFMRDAVSGFQFEIGDLEALACAVLDAAASVTLPLFRRPVAVHDKGRDGAFDPVTPADRWAERAMRALLAQQVPGDRVMGEKDGVSGGEGEDALLWVLDPIDGTKSYIAGIPLWGTLVGVWRGDEPLLGAIDHPALGERFIGSVRGAWRLSGGAATPLRVRPCARLSAAVLCATEPGVAGRLAEQALMARYSTDAYGAMLLASGLVDAVVESGLTFHDLAAVVPIVRAAGGIITDWTGGTDFGCGRVVAAGDGRVHSALLSLLAQEPLPCHKDCMNARYGERVPSTHPRS